jgi:branched-chain amino acid transport system ATP-binding protein
MAQEILELSDVHTYYGDTHVLHGVSLKVEKGARVAILGRNGMGKTTLIRSITGFTPPSSGAVRLRGREISNVPSYRIAQMGLALVPQGRRIFPSLSVKENLTVAARNTNKRGLWSLEKVHALFPILKERANLKGNLLSGGEQQMLCIGRALMTNPDLLLMDEPSEGLAPLIIRELGRVLKEISDSGLSIMLAEQHLGLALGIATDVYIINKGIIVFHATPDELKANEEAKNRYLGVTMG